MDDSQLQKLALANLPSQTCPITGREIQDPIVMHRDLSDFWPSTLHDMRDDRLANVIIVEKEARERYYAKIKQLGVVLSFSGGLDSTTVLHWCMKLFGKVHCVMFNYGQRHAIELEHAREYIKDLDVTSQVVDMSVINSLASSALTRDSIVVPRNTPIDEMSSKIPTTFVPGRNVYFLTAIAQAAYANGGRHVAMGVNALDYSGYPDCRPEFIAKMREALSIGIFNGFDFGVHAPLMYLNKTQIIRLGLELGVKYENTHSCYNGVKGGCGECDSCIIRRTAFRELGMEDPSIETWSGK